MAAAAGPGITLGDPGMEGNSRKGATVSPQQPALIGVRRWDECTEGTESGPRSSSVGTAPSSQNQCVGSGQIKPRGLQGNPCP